MRLRWSGMVALAGITVLLGACASDARGADPSQVMRSARRATGADWAAAERPSGGPGSPLVSTCGDPRRLGEAFAGATSVDVGPVRQRRVAEPGSAQRYGVDGYLRVAAARFADEAGAQRAMASVTPAVLERCVVDAVNGYLRTSEPGDFDPVGPATAADFETHQLHRATGGRPAVVQSAFQEEVLGGYDNGRTVNVALTRSGATVVLVTTAVGEQSSRLRRDAGDVERLAAEITRTAR